VRDDPAAAVLFSLYAAVVLAAAVRSGEWLLLPALALPAPLAFHLARSARERGFYLLCAGVPLVVAAGLLYGIVLQLVLLALALHTQHLLPARRDAAPFLAFCGAALLVYPLAAYPGSLLLPLLLIAGGVLFALLALRISAYRLIRRYTGAER